MEDPARACVEAELVDGPVPVGPEKPVARKEFAAGDGPVRCGLVLGGGGAGELGVYAVALPGDRADAGPIGWWWRGAREGRVGRIDSPRGPASMVGPASLLIISGRDSLS
ncbi:hypothetical protein GCM10010336_51050 [Streptomyces goshikiensis]|nr:hypothetical protein GCM10010336_51050 [Streptomyces goshikiensis]